MRSGPQQLSAVELFSTVVMKPVVLRVCSPGYMAGYVVHRKPRVASVCELKTEGPPAPPKTSTPPRAPAAAEPAADVQPTWKDLTQLLAQNLKREAFENTLRYADSARPQVWFCTQQSNLLLNHSSVKSLCRRKVS